MSLFDVVVTRHKELVQYLKEIGVVDEHVEVIEHATAENINDKNVIGVLPHSLSCLTETFAEVPLNIPQEMSQLSVFRKKDELH